MPAVKKYSTIYKLILILSTTLALIACGGGGGSDNDDETEDTITTNPPTSNKIFIYDGFNAAITSIDNANPGSGSISLDEAVTGGSTNLGGFIDDMTLDIANDRLYVANGFSILVFNNISTATGNTAPSRVITSPSFGTVAQLFLDTENDLLYATDMVQGIWVIRDISTANGSITPERSITNGFGTSFTIQGLVVDTNRDILYVSVRGISPLLTEQILVVDNASLLDTTLIADRTINLGTNPGKLVLDQENDQLYMTNLSNIRVFHNASTQDGTPTPDRLINVPGESGLTNLISDMEIDVTNDRLYVINNNLLEIVQNASIANGATATTQLSPAVGSNSLFDTLTVAP